MPQHDFVVGDAGELASARRGPERRRPRAPEPRAASLAQGAARNAAQLEWTSDLLVQSGPEFEPGPLPPAISIGGVHGILLAAP